jgi:hypothetical protein
VLIWQRDEGNHKGSWIPSRKARNVDCQSSW